MSVAETHPTERMARNPQQQLAIGSFVGAAVLLAGLGFIFAALPWYWAIGWDALFAGNEELKKNNFLSDALLILLELIVIAGFALAAYRALQQQTQPGLRAGIFFAALYVFSALWIGIWLGRQLDTQIEEVALGWVVVAAVVASLVAGAAYAYLMLPGWRSLLEAIEHQGWFHGYAYKGNQGVRVRRGTIVGILAVGVCGIITMITHRFFGTEGVANDRSVIPNDWYWTVPYDHDLFIPLMFKVHLLMPIVLGVLLLWLAWRVVNIPGFADFLIATEAEMNKVSWTNRRRLFQDTIVVLTTVFLFTAFLFVVDVIWIKVLSAPGIQVLLIDPKQEQQKQQEKAQW